MPLQRLAVFVDYQNVYHRARRCFGLAETRGTHGQVDPLRLAQLVAARRWQSGPAAVRVYRGEPSLRGDPVAAGAVQRQAEAWRRAGVEVVTRPLQYLGGRAREKGIDVLIALDMAEGAWRDRFDVAVLASGDTDLVPAVQRVLAAGRECEVVAWRSAACRARLPVPGVPCHWLDRRDYERVHDPTDFTSRGGA